MDDWLQTDEEHRELDEHEKRARRLATERDEALREVLSTVRGRAVVWRLMNGWTPELVGLHGSSWHQDVAVMSRLEGHREVAILVMQDAQRVGRTSYNKMVDEALHAEEMAELVASAQTTKPT